MNDIITALDGLPADREVATAEWLCRALAPHAVFADDRIDSIDLSPMGDGIGQASELVAADVHTASGTTHRLLVKLQVSNPGMHGVAMLYRNYEREARFYALLADQVPLRTPNVLISAFDGDAERVLIVMERFEGFHSPDQVAGASVEEITIATEQLAGLTAAFWNSPLRERYDWLGTPLAPYYHSLPDDYAGILDTALGNYAHMTPSSTESAARRISAGMRSLLNTQAEGHHVLTHWDYRVENMFFGPDGEFVLIDWQLMQWQRPGFDFAYLLGTNMEVALRREAEQELIEIYLDGLARHGVRDYSRDEFLRDMRLGLLQLTCIPVIGGGNADLSNPRNEQLFGGIMARSFQMIEDWDALEVLPV